MSILGLGILSGIINGASTGISRRHSYQLNERVADNADLRTRALYHDLYGIAAQKEQMEQAGLSTGLMYAKGNVGGSGQAGAQAAPANAQFVQAFDLANLKMMEAQIEKTKAETRNTDANTDATEKGMQLTDAQIEKTLEEKGLVSLQKDYQALVNDITNYEKVFKFETTETNIKYQKELLREMTAKANKMEEEAKTAGADAIFAQSTLGDRIAAVAQQVSLNEMEMRFKQSQINVNKETIDKIKTDIFNETLQTQILEAKTAEEIEALQQRVINETTRIVMEQEHLDLEKKRLILDIVKGAFGIWNESLRTGVSFLGTAGNLIKDK